MREILLKRSLIFTIVLFFIGLSVSSSMGGYSSNQMTKIDSLPLQRGPLAYWAFDECSGTTAEDSEHGYDGTINGATWTTEGYSGCALVFDGADDYVDLDTHAPNLGLNKTDDYTISAYFKSTSSSTGSIFSMSHTNVARAFAYLDLNDDGTISYKTGDETCLFELYTPGAYNDGSWHFVEIKFFGETVNPTLEIYVDGSLKASLTEWLCPYLAEDFITAKIGRRSASGDEPFDGTIDEVRLYKTVGDIEPPTKPAITGPSQGTAGQELTFTFTSTDPQDQDIIYEINWGDNTQITTSPQMESGATYTAKHTYNADGSYQIKATATNLYGETSETGTKNVEIPRTRAVDNHLLLKFFEQHPNLFPIIRYLLGL
ncbi:MAG: hypothetical protein AYK22_03700 [Thermoplasmatales archaeon SG8-52-3]|nr:MAG: hypothetical protein AYK22_03700 [Thermoplasmatales archaeon SG8-52-3]